MSNNRWNPSLRHLLLGFIALVAVVFVLDALASGASAGGASAGGASAGAQPVESADIGPTERLEQRLEPMVDEAFSRLRVLISYLPLVAIGLAIIFAFVLLSRLVGRADGFFARITPNRFARDLLRQAIRVSIILIGVLIALEILDATALVGAVLGTAGVVGLAIGFAFRDLVENYIASILLSLRQPFAPNDFVVINDHQGHVVRLTSRATILMTPDGNHLRIPNATVFKGIVLNYTRNPHRRFDFGVGVGVGEDLREARRIGLEAFQAMPGVLDDPAPSALIQALGDSNVLVRYYGWVDQRSASFGKVKSEAIRQVKTVLEQAGMDLPEPIYRVVLKNQAEAASSERVAKQPVDVDPTSAEDIEPEHHVEDQIDRERAADEGGQDLLDRQAPTE